MGDKNIIVTGPPRCGKSTLIEKVVSKIERPCIGFFTRELKEGGKRVGFAIVTLSGQEGILAHEDHPSKIRVGKYGVNLRDLEQIAVPSIIPSHPKEIVIIDEIGKMECFSPLFRKTLSEVLDSKNRVLGSIALKGGGFIQEIKGRRDVQLVMVSEKNRDSLVEELLGKIQGEYDAGSKVLT